MTLRLLDLFSGIGGFSLGLERSGAFNTVAFCEIDPFCRRVLAKHWPGVPIFEDIKTMAVDRSAKASSGRYVRGRIINWEDCGGLRREPSGDVGRTAPQNEDAGPLGRSSAQRPELHSAQKTSHASSLPIKGGENQAMAGSGGQGSGQDLSNVWWDGDRYRPYPPSIKRRPNGTDEPSAFMSHLSSREVPQGQKGGLHGSLASVGPIDVICGGFP